MTNIKYTAAFLFICSSNLWAQRPREIDIDNDPVNLSDPATFITVVILPLFFIIAGLLLVRRQKRRKKEQEK